MTRFAPRPAQKHALKARLALAGVAGAGKTFTALTIASVWGERIAVIDTEHRSAELYADRFKFDTISWDPPFDPRQLADAITDPAAASYDTIIIDSLSHFWAGEGGTLEIVDAAGERARGNRFAGWKTGTPAQNDMVEAMLRCPAHIIATMRAKTEYVQEKDRDGKTQIKRVGLAPVQRDQIEFEFTVTAELNIEHVTVVDKTRCPLLSGQMYRGLDVEKMAIDLLGWLEDGDVATPEPETVAAMGEERRKLNAALQIAYKDAGYTDRDAKLQHAAGLVGRAIATSNDLTDDEVRQVLAALKAPSS